ncbi:MAG: Pr6Pr family membrane protein [Pseudobdellovibrio sp.]
MKKALILLTSVLGFAALIIQMISSVERKLEQGFSLLYALNHYFSYFTIIINSTVAVLFLTLYFFPNSKCANWFKKSTVNGALCLYILVVGLIFYALLYPTSTETGIQALASHILHGFVPLAYAYLWYSEFSNKDLAYHDSFKWLVVPLVYFIYLIIRGAIINAYPYFFVDVSKYGYVTVLEFAIGILLFFTALGCLLVFADKRRLAPATK